MADIETLQSRLLEYEKRMGIGTFSPAKEAYFVYVEQLRQATEYLKDFKIKDHIGNVVKDNPVYARAIELRDGLPKMITSVNTLKVELKMEGEERKQEYKPISAKEIANGNV